MNRHFLEFWGRAFLQAAKSQKQLEDLASWFHRGFLGFQDYTQLALLKWRKTARISGKAASSCWRTSPAKA